MKGSTDGGFGKTKLLSRDGSVLDVLSVTRSRERKRVVVSVCVNRFDRSKTPCTTRRKRAMVTARQARKEHMTERAHPRLSPERSSATGSVGQDALIWPIFSASIAPAFSFTGHSLTPRIDLGRGSNQRIRRRNELASSLPREVVLLLWCWIVSHCFKSD